MSENIDQGNSLEDTREKEYNSNWKNKQKKTAKT